MAMRALAAIVVIVACASHYRAHAAHGRSATRNHFTLSDQILTLLGVSPRSVHNAIECTSSIGLSKCIAALSIWRAGNAAKYLGSQDSTKNKLFDDIREFPWKLYANSSQDEVGTRLCDGTEKLLRYRALKLRMVPGYEVELVSKGNGTLKVDILRGSPTGISRGMKQFYNIVPFLILPGLIMSAILPFVLPALKMMTVAVGMLNNMALSGAVFTLLRNNAFSDRYEKKVIYVNEGYKNEQHKHGHYNIHDPGAVYEIQFEDKYNPEHFEGTLQIDQNIDPENVKVGELEIVQEIPESNSNTDWIKQYYGLNNNNKYISIVKADANSRRRKYTMEN